MKTGKRDQDNQKPMGKHFTKALLITANDAATKKGLNRQLDEGWCNTLPEDSVLPIEFTLLHDFAAGRPVERHVRCTFRCPGGESAAVDCPMDIYDSLPGDANATARLPNALGWAALCLLAE
jgi:hypothetical protein